MIKVYKKLTSHFRKKEEPKLTKEEFEEKLEAYLDSISFYTKKPPLAKPYHRVERAYKAYCDGKIDAKEEDFKRYLEMEKWMRKWE